MADLKVDGFKVFLASVFFTNVTTHPPCKASEIISGLGLTFSQYSDEERQGHIRKVCRLSLTLVCIALKQVDKWRFRAPGHKRC